MDRNYVEKFDATTLRQILAQAIRLKPDIVTKYLASEDALLLGIYQKNPPGRLLRRQWTYPVKVFPEFEVWSRFVKHENLTFELSNEQLLDIEPSKIGLLRTSSKYSFPCDNSVIRVDKHQVGNRRMGASLVAKDNLIFGVREMIDRFKSKHGYLDDEVLSREAWS